MKTPSVTDLRPPGGAWSAGRPTAMHSTSRGEACGVFAVYAPGEDVARLTYFGLYALQHRGQESAGIAVGDGDDILVYSKLGLVTQVFDESVLDGLTGHLRDRSRPVLDDRFVREGRERAARVHDRRDGGGIALGHNGNLVNPLELAEPSSTSSASRWTRSTDSHMVCALLAQQDTSDLVEAFKLVAPKLQRRVLDHGDGREARDGDPRPARRAAARASDGCRPGGWVFASETCALDIIGADYIRDVEPGELVVVDENGAAQPQLAEPTPRLCVFEFVYFARPDSNLFGRSVYEVRRAMGKQLADEAPADADLVIPVPRGGDAPRRRATPTASGLPYAEGFVEEPVRRPDVHPADAVDARAGRAHEAEPAARGDRRQAPRRRRRLDRPRDDDARDRRDAPPRRRARGAPARELAARSSGRASTGSTSASRDELDRRARDDRGDPRAHRRRLARLPVDRRDADVDGRPDGALLPRVLLRGVPDPDPRGDGADEERPRGPRIPSCGERPSNGDGARRRCRSSPAATSRFPASSGSERRPTGTPASTRTPRTR